MPVRPRPVAVLALALGALLLLAGCGGSGDTQTTPAPQAPTPGRTLTVVATTNVWGSVASAVAGPGVEVRSIIQDPAADPHSYESTPAGAAAITNADLVVYNGGGYDEWVEQILDGDPALQGRAVEAFALRGDQAQENEHVWFDPTAVKGVVTQIADRLAAVEPAQADALRQRASTFSGRVDEEAARLAAIGQARPGSRVLATEPIAHYLLASAGVADATPPAFSEAIEEGTDVSASVLSETLDLFSRRKVSLLAYNEQTSGPETEKVKDAAAAAKIPVVPVTETLPAGKDYVSWMSGNLTAIQTALG